MKLFPFQQQGVSWLIDHFRALLADEPGLGKTPQALSLAQECPGVSRLLVVCPATLKLNWAREAKTWAPRFQPTILSSCKPQPISNPSLVIVNFDILHFHAPVLSKIPWDMVIADEAHNLKNPLSQRGTAFFGNFINANRLLFLTGTPIPNRPRELWPLLRALAPEAWGNQEAFERQYCGGHYGDRGWWADGATNLEELNKYITPLMLRRLKRDVLPELPPKFHQIIPLETKDVWEGLGALRKLPASEKGVVESEMAKLRRLDGLAKVSGVLDHVEEVLEGKNKVVLFHYHREVGEKLAKGLERFGTVWVHGGTPEGKRQGYVDAFQQDPKVRVFVGQIQAAGEGITLTASDHVCFAEMDWVPGRMVQAEDRLARIGQKNNVLVQYLVSNGTFDAWMGEVLLRKMKNTEIALGDVDVMKELKEWGKNVPAMS